MKFKNFIFVFNWIIVVVLATVGVLLFLNVLNASVIINLLSRIKSYQPLGPYILIALCSSIIILNIVYLIVKIFFRRYASVIRVKDGNSEVSYDVDCIEDTITSNILKLPEIYDTWVSIKVPRKNPTNLPTEIEVGFSLYEGYSGKSVSQKIKDIAVLTLKHLIDYDKEILFRIRLNKIVSKNPPKKDKNSEPPQLFRGPIYPIEDDIE